MVCCPNCTELNVDILTKSNDDLRFLLSYMASCFAATAEQALDKKTTSKRDLKRHLAMCARISDALYRKPISMPEYAKREANIEESQKRLQEVINELCARTN